MSFTSNIFSGYLGPHEKVFLSLISVFPPSEISLFGETVVYPLWKDLKTDLAIFFNVLFLFVFYSFLSFIRFSMNTMRLEFSAVFSQEVADFPEISFGSLRNVPIGV